jgi:hypothetical protein
MHSKAPTRNRLGKLLPREFRDQLHEAGIPRRKYAAVLRVALADGSVIEDMVVEEGWIIGLDRSALAGSMDRPIALNPRDIRSVEVKQFI